MSKKGLLIIIALLSFLMSGCANNYTFNNQSFTSPEEALSAHDKFLKNIEKELSPVSSNPQGHALVVTPSQKTCEALGIKRTGHPNKDIIDYIGAFLKNDLAFFSSFLTKSNIFKVVDSVIDDFPPQYVKRANKDYSAIIYFDLKSPDEADWYIIIPPDYESKKININKTEKDPTLKISSWNNDIKNQLQKVK